MQLNGTRDTQARDRDTLTKAGWWPLATTITYSPPSVTEESAVRHCLAHPTNIEKAAKLYRSACVWRTAECVDEARTEVIEPQKQAILDRVCARRGAGVAACRGDAGLARGGGGGGAAGG